MFRSADAHPVTIARVDWVDPRALALRDAMELEMSELYLELWASASDEENALVNRALAVDGKEIITSILAMDGEAAVGHAALRPFGEALEVKKVFVEPAHRGRGISKLLMHEMETIAHERGAKYLVLQTGELQAEAIALYLRTGYEAIPSFGPYEVLHNPLCFGKRLL